MTSKDAVLKEVCDVVVDNDENPCHSISAYKHRFWKDLHVKSGCLCVDNDVAIQHILHEAVPELLHAAQPGS